MGVNSIVSYSVVGFDSTIIVKLWVYWLDLIRLMPVFC